MSNTVEQNKIAISVQGATHYYKVYNDDGTVAQAIGIEGVDLDIYKGSFVALVGHNGSGKSTLANHINKVISSRIYSGKDYLRLKKSPSEAFLDINEIEL